MPRSDTAVLLDKLKDDAAAHLAKTTSRLPAKEREAFEALFNEKILLGKQQHPPAGPRKLTAADLRVTPVDFKYDDNTAGYKFIGRAKCALDGLSGACHHHICVQAKGDGLSYLEYDTIIHYKRRITAAKTSRMKDALRKQRDIQLLKDQEAGTEWREKTIKKLGLGNFGPGSTTLDAVPVLQENSSPDNAVEQVGRALSALRMGALPYVKREFANIVQARITAGHGGSGGTLAYHWRNPARFVEFFATVQMTHMDAAIMNVRDILELNAKLPYEVEYCLRGLIGQCRELTTHVAPDRKSVLGYTLAEALHDVKEMIQHRTATQEGATTDGAETCKSGTSEVLTSDGEDPNESDCDETTDGRSGVMPKNDLYHILVKCKTVEDSYRKEMMRAASRSVADQVVPDEMLKQIKEAGLVDSPLPLISAIRFHFDCEHAKKLAAIHRMLDMAERKKSIAQIQKTVVERILSITCNNPHQYLKVWKDISVVEDQLSQLENEKRYSAEHDAVRIALDQAKVTLSSLVIETGKSPEEGEGKFKKLNTDQMWELHSLEETVPSPSPEIDFLFLQTPEQHGLRFVHSQYTIVDFLCERRLEGWCLPGAIVRLMTIVRWVCSRNPLRAKSIFRQLSILVDGELLGNSTVPAEWAEPLRTIGEALLHAYGYLTMECTHVYGRSDVEQVVFTLLWRLVFDALIAMSRADATRSSANTSEFVEHNLRTTETAARTWFLKISEMFRHIIEKDEMRCVTPELCTTSTSKDTCGDLVRQSWRASIAQDDAGKRYLERHRFTILESTNGAKAPFLAHDDILLQVLEEQSPNPLEASRILRYLACRLQIDSLSVQATSGNKASLGVNHSTLDILWLAFLRAETLLRRTPDASYFVPKRRVLIREHWEGRTVMSNASSMCFNMHNHCNISELCDPASRGKAVGFFEGYRLGFRGRRDIDVLLESMELYESQHGPPSKVAKWNELIQTLADSGYRCTPETAKVFRRVTRCIWEQLGDARDVARQCSEAPLPPDDDSLDTSDAEYDETDENSIDVKEFRLNIKVSTPIPSEKQSVPNVETTASTAYPKVHLKRETESVKEYASRSISPGKKDRITQGPAISDSIAKQVTWHPDAECRVRGRDTNAAQKLRDRSVTSHPRIQHDSSGESPASLPSTLDDVPFILSDDLQDKMVAVKESLNRTRTSLAPGTELRAFLAATTDGTATLTSMEQQLERYEATCDELIQAMG